ncbi:class I SAM-dependent methyltransferase [Halosimplex rubrum]|uniref:Class I SAM-dependent methyltransferase n=1 Tax=Halosimplex rubrum TaxID=869889 RepID=A0A7D5PBZ9_9EURY|nr:class I SAM-dependent methyltransferase [Halosimplex rubrum]QLH79440.1 class I SAM-dependent methyltransferase [Halosimplex rubrum]
MTDDESDGDGPSTGSVRATYDRIAEHFSKTREYPWPEVEAFLDGRSGAVALDVGCGNGRHTELLAERCERALGADLSREMVATASERSAERGFDYGLAQADASSLPVRSGCVDLGVYVATLPHLPSRDLRVASLDELARVLSSGGRALVGVWSTEHDRFDESEGFDTTVEWTLPGGESVDRFYHIYDPDEFRADIAESGLDLVEFEISSGNCYGVVRPES